MEQEYTIDPVLLAKVVAFTEHIQNMQSFPKREEELAVQMKIPRSWLLLAAWLEQFEPARSGRTEKNPVPVLDFSDRRMKVLAKRWLFREIEDLMFRELQGLCEYPERFLTPFSEEWKRALDDEVPF